MINKILFLVIVFIIVLIVLLLSPWQKNIPTQTLIIRVDKTQKSALDAVISPHLGLIKQRRGLIDALSQSPKTISIKNLWVDKYEVAQADFYKFIGWSRVYDSSLFFAPTQAKDWKFYSSSKTHGLSGKLDVSANGLSFYDAYTYCHASAGRLPEADEFQAIIQNMTRDSASQLYPWGDKFNPKPWRYFDARLNATLNPGSFPSSDTKEGVSDMGALLSEWTMGKYPRGKPFIQGGNAYSKPYEIYALTMIYRQAQAKYRSAYVGFRCVYDKKPKSHSPWKNKINTVYISNKTLKINHYPHSSIRPLLRYLPNLSLGDFKSLLPSHRQSDYQLSVGINEVSVAQYQQFLSDIFVSFGVYSHEQQPKNHNLTPLNWQVQKKYPNRPVVGIDWWSAYHFANWVGGRLPSNNESIKIQILASKQKSVFKHQQQAYPNTLKSSQKITHFSGNVSEWTRSIDTSKENLSIIVRGGSFFIEKKHAQKIDFYRAISPHHRAKDIGFRVVFPDFYSLDTYTHGA